MNVFSLYKAGLQVMLCVCVITGSLAKRKPNKTRTRPAISEEPSSTCQLTCGENQYLDQDKCRCVCDEGYKNDARYSRCVDINECRESPSRCKGTCTNSPGSFECRCRSGYVQHSNGWDCYKAPKILPCKGLACYGGARLHTDRCSCDCGGGMRYNFITEECEDVNECALDMHSCEQGCLNTNKGYICYCQEGFRVNRDNRTCTAQPAKPYDLPCSGMMCPRGTSLDVFHCECLCEEGFYFAQRAETCTDVNECREHEDWCDGGCVNEPHGSYTCSCPKGQELAKDGWTCDPIMPFPDDADVDDCTESHFMCADRKQCVPDELVCDGYGDCRDRSDENDCKESCNSQDFPCANGEKCIHRDNACNSDNDCGDWSDELECGCQDERDECNAWEFRGECESNPGWMQWHCRRSCGQCEPGDATGNGTLSEETETAAYFVRHSAKFSTSLQYTRRNKGERPGTALNTWQCDSVSTVPKHVRVSMGLSPFYEKYTNAYAIPIVGSARVSDEAIKRACYVVRVMLADRRDLRQQMYVKFARVAVVAENELTLHIPEHSHLPETFSDRVRSLGGTLYIPLTSAAEENLLCRDDDRWRAEDTFVHSLAQSILKIGLGHDRQFYHRLSAAYYHARREGLWADTRSDDSLDEYFADGVQSFFGVQAPHRRGVHNGVDSREKLERYDSMLFKSLAEVFPCKNKLIDRCQDMSNLGQVYVNCQVDSGTETPTEAPLATDDPESESACEDKNRDCAAWATAGECSANKRYMKKNCALSCEACTINSNQDPQPQTQTEPPHEPDPIVDDPVAGPEYRDCDDSDIHCQDWARRGECDVNPIWMRPHCPQACNACEDDPNCYDSSNNCEEWAADGECEKNEEYMTSNCMLSCGVC